MPLYCAGQVPNLVDHSCAILLVEQPVDRPLPSNTVSVSVSVSSSIIVVVTLIAIIVIVAIIDIIAIITITTIIHHHHLAV